MTRSSDLPCTKNQGKLKIWPDLILRKYILHLFPATESTSSCSRSRQSSFLLLLLSALLNLLCLHLPQVAALKPFPGAAANPVWSRAHVLGRGAIRGLTLPRRSLLKTDRLSGTPRSSHLKHAAIASCCRNDHAPVIGTRESPLVRKHVGLQIKSCPAKLLRMTCAASSRSAVMHSSVERRDTAVG